ncbi:CHRD domain-containing protein [Phenylobacterium sp. LjRoot225]|uniref:CHRD domain-containing protein n=1 Tax=Phenylobacterium sp. LjRoot225 TaxID=3342285 RepID=UPI003ECD7B5E
MTLNFTDLARAASAVLVLSVGAGLTGHAYGQEGGRPLAATLSGAAEKPTAGDPDGSGAASLKLNIGQGQICYDLQVKDIGVASMAHIHKAPPASAGPVVVSLTAPGADGKSSDCATVDRELVKDILQNPGAYYVNVHNAEFPGGAVRGQLSK